MSKIFKYAALFVSGLVSGIVVGLATAPKSGKELREDIVHKSEEWQDMTKDKLANLQESSKVKTTKVIEAIKNNAGKISSKISTFTRDKENDNCFIERM